VQRREPTGIALTNVTNSESSKFSDGAAVSQQPSARAHFWIDCSSGLQAAMHCGTVWFPRRSPKTQKLCFSHFFYVTTLNIVTRS
jgi:hypothetical protein